MRSLAVSTLALAVTIGGGIWLNSDAKAAANSENTQIQASKGNTQKDSTDSSSSGQRRGKSALGFHNGGKGRFEGKQGLGASSEELASLLGITTDELKQALKAGKSLADIAGEKKVGVQSVIDLLVKQETERLDQSLKDGKLTQAQYDERKAELTEHATKWVNGKEGDFPGGGKKGFEGGRGGMFDASSKELATLFGMTTDELTQARKAGKSLADIAGEKKVSVQNVVDLLVKKETERLDQLLKDGKLTQAQYDERKADLADRTTKFVNRKAGDFSRGGKEGFEGGRGGMFGASSEELAALLGLTTDELKQAHKDGKSLADIATEKNVSVQSVIDLLVKKETERLDQLLKDGKLTQEQYDKYKADLADRTAKLVNGEFPDKDKNRVGKHSGDKGRNSETDTSTKSAS